MSGVIDERVTDEIEALRAILLDDELKVIENERGEPESIETIVFPSTGEDSQSQYVCVRLVVILPPGYPDATPDVHLKNPRGLDEETVRQIQSDADAKCKDFLGQPVMFELIELVREHLTVSNLPTGQCAVCLYGFREGDEFTKTECYHHFHSYCLAAHVVAAEGYYREEQEKLPLWQQDTTNKFQALCPVCREPINCKVKDLKGAPPPIDVETATDFSLTQELQDMQRQMAELYVHQQRRGGIIDLEAEGVKLLLNIDDDSTAVQPSPPGTSLNAIASQPTQMSKQNQSKQQQQQQQQSQSQNNSQSRQTNHQQPQQSQNHHHHHHRNHRGRGKAHNRRHFDRMRHNDSATR